MEFHKYNDLICIIPIRAGSQTIKNKNIILLKQKPLIYYTLKAAIKSNIFKKIIISTDSKEYIKKIKKLKINQNKIIYHNRSKKNASSTSTSESVLLEVIKHYGELFSKKTIINFIQATSPLIKSLDLINANKIFKKRKLNSMFSCSKSKSFIWEHKKNLQSLNYNYKKRPRRQDIKKKYLVENGSFYIFLVKGFIKHKNRLFEKIGFFEMPKYRSFEIDDMEDVKLIKKII